MTIRLFLSQNQFDLDERGENGDFMRFVRYYDELALAAFFDHMTGEFYAVRFESTDELLKHRHGDFQLSERPETGFWGSAIRYRGRINILPMVNLHRVETARDLKTAFQAFDQMVEIELKNTPKHGFEFGDRVIIYTPGDRDQIGTVAAFTGERISVRMESGATSPFVPARIRKIKTKPVVTDKQ